MVATDEPVAPDYRWVPVLGLYLFTAFWSSTQLFIFNGATFLLAGIIMAWLATSWVVMDSRKQGKPLLHILQLVVFLTWPVAVPIWLFATRRMRGLGLSLYHATCLALVVCIFFYGTILLVWGADALLPV